MSVAWNTKSGTMQNQLVAVRCGPQFLCDKLLELMPLHGHCHPRCVLLQAGLCRCIRPACWAACVACIMHHSFFPFASASPATTVGTSVNPASV